MVLTLTLHVAPTIIPKPCDINVTMTAIIKNKPNRNASSGCAVIMYVIKTYTKTHANCNGKSANVKAK